MTIGTWTYIADQIEVNRPSKTIERTSEIDEPNGQVSYATFITGTATLQLATGSVIIPVQGSTFASTFVASVGSETFYLSDIGQPESKDAEKKVHISFRKKYN